VDFSILHPLPEDYAAGKKNNALSCVLRIEAGGRRLLLTGDIAAADEAALLAREKSRQAGMAQPGKIRLDENQRVPALAADAILAPHHGAAGSSSPAFVAAVGAREAIFSAGYRNRFQHPRPAVLQRYADHGARLWRTDTGGSIHVRLGGGKLEIHAWRERHARYWHGR
ncbi:MAG: ComEC/Rec2 family competence protein, partial [Azonexus sp.]